MRVLVLHSRYRSGSSSGENRVVEDEVQLLSENGHEVTLWAPSIDPGRGSARTAIETIWSRRAIREIESRIDAVRPDVVHIHNLFPALSPAAIRASAKHAPVVMTLHNFRLTCLAATLLRENQVCEDCVGHSPLRGLIHGCYRDSRAESAILAASISLHRFIGSFPLVSCFSPVSEFVGRKLSEAGVIHDRIRVKPNFAWPTGRKVNQGHYFLALGRLSVEKGIDTIVNNLPPGARLLVAGDGPQRAHLDSVAGSHVTFLGAVDSTEVPGLLRDAQALLVPSRCYEGQPRVILEAFAAGVPVLASRIGGLPELLDDGVNGLLVHPDDAVGWGTGIERLMDRSEASKLGEGAYRTWQERFTPEVALQNLESLYKDVMTGGLVH